MESTRRVTTVRQIEILVEFLKDHPDLALGRVRSKEARATANRLWSEVAESLNVEGPTRTSKEWAKVWNDLKCKVRAKMVARNANQHATGGGPSTASNLTPLEEKISEILGRDIGPLQNVAQNHLISTEEEEEEPNIVIVPHHDNKEHESPPFVLPNNNEVIQTSPVPSTSGQAPATPPGSGDRSRILRGGGRLNQSTTRRHETTPVPRRPMQSGRNALEESRAMVLHIERLRAEAALDNARTRTAIVNNLMDCLRSIADSIDRYTRRYDQHNE